MSQPRTRNETGDCRSSRKADSKQAGQPAPPCSAFSIPQSAFCIQKTRGIRCRMPRWSGLLSQAQASDHLLVAGAVLAGQVLEQLVPPADHLQQSAAGRVVLLVGVEV